MSGILSRPIRAAHIKEAPREYVVTADEAECAALAAVFKLPGIGALQGRFTLRHERGGIIAAELNLKARVTQVCVVTLEPFEARIDEPAILRFVPARQMREGEDLGEVDAETLEAPDEIPYAGEMIDLGAALAEQLALSLDPYPRKPGAVLPEAAGDAAVNPFAALARRKATDEADESAE